MVSISTTVHLPDDKVDEAIADLRRLNDPSNLITYNDGWFASSLTKKWRMDLHTLEALVKQARNDRSTLLYKPNDLNPQIANQLIEEGMRKMMYHLEGYIIDQKLPSSSVDWFAEQIADRIKERHRAGKPTY